jgi:hypothetical protein
MYAIFLLALLADVALSQVLVPVGGGESADRLMLSAAGPLVGSARVVAPLRVDRSLRNVGRLKSYRLAASGLARIFAGEGRRSTGSDRCAPLILAGLLAGPEIAFDSLVAPPFGTSTQAPGIFAHTSSPAP